MKNFNGSSNASLEAMTCTDEQKMIYATYMVVSEAEHWWKGTKALLQAQEIPLIQEQFKTIFLEKYFLVSVKNQKETKFLQLKQGNMTVGQYVSKFEELARFSSYLKYNPNENWKAKKFEYKLNPKIKSIVSTMETRNYALLVNKYKLPNRT